MKRLNAMLVATSRTIIASAFWLATRLSNRVKVSGIQHDTGASPAYLAMSHKRDLDPMVLIPTLLFHRGWRALAGKVHFFLRGDAFSPGYLARLVRHPRWLSFMLRWVPIGLALRWLGTYLADLDAWLWRGGSLYASAEGQLSPLGLLSPISAAFHRLMRAAPPETSVVPIFLIYDFMTTQQLRIFVDLGPTIERAPTLPPAELDAQLRERWLAAATFTCTQLGSGFLAQAGYSSLSSFTLQDLASSIHAQAKSLAAAGRYVDQRLLDLRGAR